MPRSGRAVASAERFGREASARTPPSATIAASAATRVRRARLPPEGVAMAHASIGRLPRRGSPAGIADVAGLAGLGTRQGYARDATPGPTGPSPYDGRRTNDT